MKLKDLDFRIWDKGEETLTYASKDWKLDIGFSNPQQDYGVCESELHAYYDGEPMCPSDCEIELWSGFYDCKGTKIYEGDIVKYESRTRPLVAVFERSTFYIVDTSIEKHLQVDCGTRLQGIYENGNSGYTNQKLECLEVLGNIHENAELLKTELEAIKDLENESYKNAVLESKLETQNKFIEKLKLDTQSYKENKAAFLL